jgi:RND family efflux transporter MFP subunit
VLLRCGCFAAGLAAVLSACAKAPPPAAPRPVTVQTSHLVRRTLATFDNLDGQVAPYLQSSLSTQQSGTIVAEFANEGDRVRSGELLAKIDDSPLVAQLVQQRGNAVQAVAKLNQSSIQLPITNQQYSSALEQDKESLRQAIQQESTDRASLRNAHLVYAGNAQLLAQGYVAQTTYEQSRSSYVAAQQTLRQDTEKVTQARAALEAAERNLLNTPLQQQVIAENRGSVTTAYGQVQATQTSIKQTTLTAPFDGVVTERMLDPGAYAGPSEPLFQISQVDPIYVDFNAKDDDLRYVQPGTLVSFVTNALPGRRYQARVVSLNVVPTTGTLLYRGRLVLRNPDFSLRGGMLVTVRVTKELHADVVVAPRSAVTQDNGKGVLFRVERQRDAGGEDRWVAVETPAALGLQNDAYVEVSNSNLHEGTEIITSPPTTVNDKTPIRPVK